jgi:UDP-glucose 4-epimerase
LRILVTGSSGFLGRHALKHLTSVSDFDVLGFDLVPNPCEGFRAIVGDLCDLDAVERACRGVDVVLHLGGVGDVDVAMADPSLALSANVIGTNNIAIGAANAGARVVYASTWEVYGRPRYEPVDEAHPCAPNNVYAASKLSGELVLSAAQQSGAPQCTTLRLGTAYGPGMRSNTVIGRFVSRARAGQPLAVQGTGNQWRQFTHTSDIVRGMQRACEREDALGVFNIVAKDAVTIRSLAELIAGHFDVPITFEAAREGDPISSTVSSALAHTALGWSAHVPFDVGVAQLLGG